MQKLNGRKVAILATDGFEQVELTSPRQALEKAGAQCLVLSPKSGEIQGMKHHDKGEKVKVDVELANARAEDFDAVLLPGGVINGDALRIDKKAQEFVRQIDAAGKPVMVICHGGWILASAGLTKGRRMTSWPTLKDDLENAGATWEDRELIRDRNWVSSRKPDDLPAFNAAIVEAVGGRPSARQEDRGELRP